jgi:hypothetical protein
MYLRRGSTVRDDGVEPDTDGADTDGAGADEFVIEPGVRNWREFSLGSTLMRRERSFSRGNCSAAVLVIG